jgi:hypothetical protein
VGQYLVLGGNDVDYLIKGQFWGLFPTYSRLTLEKLADAGSLDSLAPYKLPCPKKPSMIS